MSALAFAPAPIPPIIMRHAQDAAWRFTQLMADRNSPLVDFERQAHFHKLLAAHLDGLRVAGAFGWETALGNFEQWPGAGEAFVCWLLALESGQAPRIERMWELCAADLRYRFAVGAALAWMDEAAARPYMDLWLGSEELPEAAGMALNAFGLRRLSPARDISPFLRHEKAYLRAEACRYAGRMRRADLAPALEKSVADADPEVREQAAAALLLCGRAPQALGPLREAVMRRHDLALKQNGLAGILAGSRCAHLAGLWGQALPFAKDMAENDALLETLPPRPRLLAVAAHGDARRIPGLIRLMAEEASLSRQALWAMCFIVGLDADLAAGGGPPAPREIADAASDAASDGDAGDAGPDAQTRIWDDAGLAWPAAELAEKWWAEHEGAFAPDTPWLGGGPALDPQNLLALARSGSQVQRLAASVRLTRLGPDVPWLDNRAPLRLQLATMERINACIGTGGQGRNKKQA